MDYTRRIKYQKIASLVIAAAGSTAAMQANTDKLYEKVTGLLCSVIGDENGIQNSVFNKFEIDSQEVFPAGYEAKLVATHRNQDVKPDEKYYAHKDIYGSIVPFNARNSMVSIEYQDGAFAGVAYPYTVNVYLRLENPDEKETAVRTKIFGFLENLYQRWTQEK